MPNPATVAVAIGLRDISRGSKIHRQSFRLIILQRCKSKLMGAVCRVNQLLRFDLMLEVLSKGFGISISKLMRRI
jgi:hypothetical protein